MAERVNARCRGQARRQRQRQLRITDHEIRDHVQIHRHYLAAVQQAHHTGAADLRAGAGGCGNGDLGRYLANLLRAACLDVVVGQPAAMAGQQRHRLGKVDGRPAAECDDPVAPPVVPDFKAIQKRLFGGVLGGALIDNRL